MTRWWSSASIRTRLTAWYVGAMCLMLLFYATATYFAVRHEFFEQLDDQLKDDFEVAESLVAPNQNGGIAWSVDRRHDADDDVDRGTDVWSLSGEPILRSGVSAELPPVVPTRQKGARRYESVLLSGHHWRTLAGTALIGSQSFVLRVSRSEDRLRMQIWEILVVLALGVPLIVVLAGVGGYVLARRALTPIDHLASEAQRITAERLHERLSVPNEHDEIGRLAGVINETLARLDASFAQLRRFTADASHELRTPLSVIRGTGEMTLRETRTAAEYKEAMGSMLEEVDRLTRLVDTLLRLSRADAGTVPLRHERLNLGDVVAEATASLSILAEERNQRLEADLAPDVFVKADRLIVREALTNVIDNAIKYGPPGSVVRIRATSREGRGIVSVADEGPGITPEHRQRVFDRFYRVDEGRSRDKGGTGLGLAIAKWAVEANDGAITFESGAKGGSVFEISLPLKGENV
ncbi:MAG TPA: ATP-binding protein [Vicinamibacterales bacterium]|nr:ATP-binding protein [Vicinamibacterales bacterium]